MEEVGIEELIEAVEANELRKVQSILKKQPELLDEKDSTGLSPLIWSVHFEFEKIFKYFIKQNADVNIPDDRGDTPLHYTAKKGLPAYAKILIEHGADLDARNNHYSGERTPLYLAAERFDQSSPYVEPFREVAELLIASGATYDANSAVHMGDNEKLKELITENPNLGIVALNKFELLENAAAAQNFEAASMLLAHGLTPDYTSLKTAVWRVEGDDPDAPCYEILKLYLEAGAGQFLHETCRMDSLSAYERAKEKTSVPPGFMELIEKYNPVNK